MIPPKTNPKFDVNNYRMVHSTCQFISDCQHKLSIDQSVYPIFDNKGYVHMAIWKSLNGRYKIHNSTKTNHKDILFLDFTADINTAFIISKHTSIDNLYKMKPKFASFCYDCFIEFNETHIRKTYIIDDTFDEDVFKKTNIIKINSLLELKDDTKLNSSEEEHETKRKRKVKN